MKAKKKVEKTAKPASRKTAGKTAAPVAAGRRKPASLRESKPASDPISATPQSSIARETSRAKIKTIRISKPTKRKTAGQPKPAPVIPVEPAVPISAAKVAPKRVSLRPARLPAPAEKPAVASRPNPVATPPSATTAKSSATKSATPISKLKSARTKRAKPQAAAQKTLPKLPPILLEGDSFASPPVSGPGEKFALGPTPPAQTFATDTAVLPESYGTKTLFLTARDPHWLYAHWDFTREQLSRYNRLSSEGHLVLRVFYDAPEAGLAVEIHVHPESRHWFAHVERATTTYSAELGYYNKAGQWVGLVRSGATLTPPETIADPGLVAFATIPVDVPFAALLDIVKETAVQQQPLARAIEELREQGHPELPKLANANPSEPSIAVVGRAVGKRVGPTEAPMISLSRSINPPEPAEAVKESLGPALSATTLPERTPGIPTPWTPAQERALSEILTLDEERRVWVGSLEITELLRRQIEHGVSSIAAAELNAGAAGAGPPGPKGAVTSWSQRAAGAGGAPKGFWFNINAELIIYGATERDAEVSIGGRKIKLRPDGTFSYRFALPDGRYDLPVVAVSADGTDGRAAELKFTRATEILGEVGTCPQDPALKPPTPDNV